MRRSLGGVSGSEGERSTLLSGPSLLAPAGLVLERRFVVRLDASRSGVDNGVVEGVVLAEDGGAEENKHDNPGCVAMSTWRPPRKSGPWRCARSTRG